MNSFSYSFIILIWGRWNNFSSFILLWSSIISSVIVYSYTRQLPKTKFSLLNFVYLCFIYYDDISVNGYWFLSLNVLFNHERLRGPGLFNLLESRLYSLSEACITFVSSSCLFSLIQFIFPLSRLKRNRPKDKQSKFPLTQNTRFYVKLRIARVKTLFRPTYCAVIFILNW